MRDEIIKEARELDSKFNFFSSIPDNIDPGTPIAIKDNICTRGVQTSAGSEILKGYVPPFDATVVSRLRQKGFGVLGKTTMDEFGFGTFCVNTKKIPKNPHDTTRCCGGSSGGSAGFIAASKHSRFALAQSTGGSISCPASFCGVIGFTPTYGRVSRYGLVDYSNSLDKIGVIAKTVKDASEAMRIISGKDEKDETCQGESFKEIKPLDKPITVGIPKEWLEQKIDPGVRKEFDASVEKMKSLGWKVIEINIPSTKFALAAYYAIALAEASTNLAKYCGLRYGATLPLEGDFTSYFSKVRGKYFHKEAKRRVLLGTYARMAGYQDKYYLQAQRIRQLLIDDFKKAFKQADIIAAPTMPVVAPKFSEIEKLTPIEAYAMDVLTVPPNLGGLPQLSLPIGKSESMPVGLHLISDHGKDELLLQAGERYGA